MIDIFTQYAEHAFRMEEGCMNPPKPLLPFEEMVKAMPSKADVLAAVDHFIGDHLVPRHRYPEAREQFIKLYDAGVFLFEADVKPISMIMGAIVALRLLVWDGKEHVNANTLLADEEEHADDYPIE